MIVLSFKTLLFAVQV